MRSILRRGATGTLGRSSQRYIRSAPLSSSAWNQIIFSPSFEKTSQAQTKVYSFSKTQMYLSTAGICSAGRSMSYMSSRYFSTPSSSSPPPPSSSTRRKQISKYNIQPASPKFPLGRQLSRSPIPMNPNNPLRIQQRRHMNIGPIIQLVLQLTKQFGPVLLRMGPAVPMALGAVLLRIIPLVGITLLISMAILIYETATFETKMLYVAVFALAYGTMFAITWLWEKGLEKNEKLAFEIVNNVLDDNVPHATTDAIYPKWESKPFKLQPAQSSISVDSKGLLLTTTWEAHVSQNNPLSPKGCEEGKSIIIGTLRLPGSVLETLTLQLPECTEIHDLLAQ